MGQNFKLFLFDILFCLEPGGAGEPGSRGEKNYMLNYQISLRALLEQNANATQKSDSYINSFVLGINREIHWYFSPSVVRMKPSRPSLNQVEKQTKTNGPD